MEGKGPYRIYDPGGGTQEEAAAAFERLVEENNKLKEKMQGIKSLGNGEDGMESEQCTWLMTVALEFQWQLCRNVALLLCSDLTPQVLWDRRNGLFSHLKNISFPSIVSNAESCYLV